MKVLFYLRQNHETVKGGDLVQINSTKTALEKIGVDIEYSSDPSKDLKNFDLVHVFNSPRFEETSKFLNNATRQKKPTVLSTIYWPKDELAVGIASSALVRFCREFFGLKITLFIWRVLKKRDKKFSLEKGIFEQAGILLPNSVGEMKQIEQVYGIRNKKYAPIVNAIDASKFKSAPTMNRESYVLSVGRIENRKNTLKLIHACSRKGYKLILVGGYDPKDDYARMCLNLAQENEFDHIGNIDQEELIPYYYHAKVHAMVSWYETPGLATMEAACGGCNIITTDRGSTKEYFGDFAVYCDPFSQESIELGLEAAINKQNNLQLREEIMKNFTWDIAASQTLDAYRSLLNEK